MFLTTHAVIASGILSYFSSLPNGLVFLISFLSHFLLDFIPHGDERLINESWPYKKKIVVLLIVGLCDLLVLSGVFIFFYNQFAIDISRLIIIIFGSILPDGLQFLFFILSNTRQNFFTKILEIIQLWHMKFHYFVADRFNFTLTVKQGLLLQLILIFITLSLLK